MGIFNYQEPTTGFQLFNRAIEQMHQNNKAKREQYINGAADLTKGIAGTIGMWKRSNELDEDNPLNNQMKADPNWNAARQSYIYGNDRSGLDAIASSIRQKQMQEQANTYQKTLQDAMAKRNDRQTAESNVSVFSEKLGDQKNMVDLAKLDLTNAINNYPEGSVERNKAELNYGYQLKKYNNLLAQLNDWETKAETVKTVSDFDEAAPMLSPTSTTNTAKPSIEQEDNAFVANVGNMKDDELVETAIESNDDVVTQESKKKRNEAVKAEKAKREAKAAATALKAAQSKVDSYMQSLTPNQREMLTDDEIAANAGIDTAKYKVANGKVVKK